MPFATDCICTFSTLDIFSFTKQDHILKCQKYKDKVYGDLCNVYKD